MVFDVSGSLQARAARRGTLDTHLTGRSPRKRISTAPSENAFAASNSLLTLLRLLRGRCVGCLVWFRAIASGFEFLNFRLQAGLQLVGHCSGTTCQQVMARLKVGRRIRAQALLGKLKDHTRAQHARGSLAALEAAAQSDCLRELKITCSLCMRASSPSAARSARALRTRACEGRIVARSCRTASH